MVKRRKDSKNRVLKAGESERIEEVTNLGGLMKMVIVITFMPVL